MPIPSTPFSAPAALPIHTIDRLINNQTINRPFPPFPLPIHTINRLINNLVINRPSFFLLPPPKGLVLNRLIYQSNHLINRPFPPFQQ